MSRDQIDHFDDSEARFRELWGPLALELKAGKPEPESLGSIAHAILGQDRGPTVERLPDGTLRRIPLPFRSLYAKTTPSREFLVRQACLNALNQHMPTITREDGPAKSMRHLVGLLGWDINWPSKHEPSKWFIQSVHDHFSVLVASYA